MVPNVACMSLCVPLHVNVCMSYVLPGRAQFYSICGAGFCSASQDHCAYFGESATYEQTQGKYLIHCTLHHKQEAKTQTTAKKDLNLQHFTHKSGCSGALLLRILIFTSQKQPSLQGKEDLKETSRPNSMASNSSFHSTQDEFESLSPPPSSTTGSGGVSIRQEDSVEEEESEGGNKEEIRLLRQALESVQMKLLETRKENRSLQAQLKPERGREREEDEGVREKGREEELMESLAELQAKLTDTQERYHQAVEEVEELRGQMGSGGGDQMEHEVKQLKAQLVQSGCEQENAAQRIRQLEEAMRKAEEERRSIKEKEHKTGQIEELYKEAQEEIRVLQVNTDFCSLSF